MKTMQKHIRLLVIAVGILLLSILFLLIVTPGIYKTLQNDDNTRALLAISLAIGFRLVLLFGYLHIIKRIRQNFNIRIGNFILIGVLLLILGLIDTDGAFAYLHNSDVLYIPLLIFISIFFDLTAAILTFIAASLKHKNIADYATPDKILLYGFVVSVGVIMMILFAFPWGIILSLAFWVYLGITVRKKQSLFSHKIENTITEKLQKRLKGLLTIAAISLTVAIAGLVIHKLHSQDSGGEESLFFYIGIIAEYSFVVASAGAIITFLKGQQKTN